VDVAPYLNELPAPSNQYSCSLSLIIYHNPACGTSRNTLAMIRQSGAEPEVIEYLKTRRPGRGWSN
jgi:hypothetical protein